MLNKFLSLLLISIGLASANAADPWPAFRGPDGDGVVRPSRSLPVEWSPTKNIAWRTEVPGEGWSSPVIGGGKVYLTAAIARDDSDIFDLSLLIFDVQSGQLEKTIAVMEQTDDRPARIHKKNSHASPTPVLADDRIYVHFGYQGTAAIGRDGEIIWVNRELYFNPTHGNGGSPLLVGDRLIFTCDGGKSPSIVALETETGKLAWQTPRPVDARKTFSFCTPSLIEVDGQQQVIAPGSDCVLALDPQTGRVIWDVRYDGYSVVPKPVYHRGLVFVSTSFDNANLLAIDPTGHGEVTESKVQWRLDRNIPKTPSMVAHDGLIYSISDDGIAMCVDAESGEIVYRRRIGGGFSASPLLAGGYLYFTSEDGETTVVKTGRKFEEVAVNDLGERTLASPAVVGEAILLRTAEALYRIEP